MSTPVRTPALLVCALATCFSQTAPTFRSDVELVAIPCVVVNEHGAPVTGLRRDEFRVFDNGVPRIVQHFWFDEDLPLTLGVIVDASESQGNQVEEHRRTTLRLLERILRPADHAFVVRVSEEIRLWADLSNSVADVRRQMDAGVGHPLGQPCPACGGTLLWNSIYEAARKLRPLEGNKALLILTDGFDSGSTHSWREAADEAHRADATVYAMQYPSSGGRRFAPDLYRLIAETGGATFPPVPGELDAVISRLETDLRKRYVLGFRPEKLNFGKARHDVRVEVTRPDLTVRARTTYFEPAR